MKFTVRLAEAERSMTHNVSEPQSVVTHIQESLVRLAIEHVIKYRPDAVFTVAEVNFLKEFESDLFYEFANQEKKSITLYRYITDKKGRQYTLNYTITQA